MNKSPLLFCFLLFLPAFHRHHEVEVSVYRYELVVCAIFQNEAPFLREWIEYHKMLGVEHFRLYNNESTDNYLEVLAPYIEQGDVTLIQWPSGRHIKNYSWVPHTQWPAFQDAIGQFAGVAKWLAIIDIDEFIVPHTHQNIPSFLKDYEAYGGIEINWQCFGTSNILELKNGMLQTENCLLKAHETSEWNYPVKSIVRPEKVAIQHKKWAPHTWHYRCTRAVMPDFQQYYFGRVEVSKIQINHYVHRSEKYFYESKIAKKQVMEGSKWSPEFIESWHNGCNQVEDLSISRFLPALKERLAQTY